MSATSIRRRLFVLLAIILVSAVALGCSQGSGEEFSTPTSSTPISVDKVQPKPVSGTNDHIVPVPGQEFPLHVWVTRMSHPPGGTFKVGDTVSIYFTCGGPVGYTAFIGVDFMSGEYIARNVMSGNPVVIDSSYRMGGGLYRLGDKCDAEGGKILQVDVRTPDITHALFQVWLVPGSGIMPDRSVPPVTFQEPLGWRRP